MQRTLRCAEKKIISGLDTCTSPAVKTIDQVKLQNKKRKLEYDWTIRPLLQAFEELLLWTVSISSLRTSAVLAPLCLENKQPVHCKSIVDL